MAPGKNTGNQDNESMSSGVFIAIVIVGGLAAAWEISQKDNSLSKYILTSLLVIFGIVIILKSGGVKGLLKKIGFGNFLNNMEARFFSNEPASGGTSNMPDGRSDSDNYTRKTEPSNNQEKISASDTRIAELEKELLDKKSDILRLEKRNNQNLISNNEMIAQLRHDLEAKSQESEGYKREIAILKSDRENKKQPLIEKKEQHLRISPDLSQSPKSTRLIPTKQQYLFQAQNGVFFKISNEFQPLDTPYLMILTSENIAEFEFVKDESTLGLAFSYVDNLRDTCDLFGTGRPSPGSFRYRDGKKGKLIKEGDYWRVIEKIQLEWT
jgi:hypothetical protein